MDISFNSQFRLKSNAKSDAELSVKGFITPIEYMKPNFHVEWGALANLRVAEPEKNILHQFSEIFSRLRPFSLVNAGRFKNTACLHCYTPFLQIPTNSLDTV